MKKKGKAPRRRAAASSASHRTSESQRLIIVGLGASAGALEAYESFLTHMPQDSGMAFVLVQHLDPHHASAMVELLASHTRMPVNAATDGAQVEANHLYAIEPGALLTIEKGKFRSKPPSEAHALHKSIDAFFRSLAEDRGERAVAVVLSGTGTDGTAGLMAVKEAGGLAMAQSRETARFQDMPGSAIATGVVDYVLPVEQMPAKLLEWAAQLRGVERVQEGLHAQIALQLERICAAVLKATGHDFSRYRKGTLLRRVERRMRLRRVAAAADYATELEQDAKEAGELLKDLLISVTQFFRDGEVFDLLARDVIPGLFEKAADVPVRLWAPGCASGEEAYSLAILAREYLAQAGREHPVQIFATDIDEEMLAVARRGRYPESIAAQISAPRLERFFVKDASGYVVCQELRDLCIFSVHNLIKDPPFSALDLISCRNLLIYMEPDLQQKLVPVFHYALRPGGWLLLGPSEALTGHPELFLTADKHWRLFRRNDAVAAPLMEFPLVGRWRRQTYVPPSLPRGEAFRETQQGAGRTFERLLLENFTPAAVMINGQGRILYFSGVTNRYLRHPLGSATVNLFDLAHGNLRLELRAAVHKALRLGQQVLREGIAFEVEGKPQLVDVVVRPLSEPGREDGLVAVVFRERANDMAREPASGITEDPADHAVIQRLEDEVRVAGEDLQAAVEELESTNEELKSANEELLSTNEELLSSNEEMATGKEEMQAGNEELETVNAELSRKVTELDTAHGDLQNLLAGTQIATLFLDPELRIKNFTPAATALFHLRENDMGRAILDLAPRLTGADLYQDFRDVLRTLATVERQVFLAEEQRWFIARILPYRTTGNAIDGLVVTFVDVTSLIQAEAKLAWLASFPKDNPNPVLEIEAASGSVSYINDTARRLFPDLETSGVGHPFLAGLPAAVEALRAEPTAPVGHEVMVGTTCYAQTISSVPNSGRLRVYGIDITGRMQAEEALRASEERFRTLANSIPNLAWWANADGFITWYNRRWYEYTGTTPEQMEGWGWQSVHDPERLPEVLERWKASIATGEPFDMEFPLRGADGRFRLFLTRIEPLKDAQGRVVRWFGTNTDVDALKRSEEALRASEERFRLLVEQTPDGIFVADHGGRYTDVNLAGAQMFGYTREEMLRLTFTDLLVADEIPRLQSQIAALAGGAIIRNEWRFRRKDGSEFFGEVVGRQLPDGSFQGVVRDMTERKRTEEVLERLVKERTAKLKEAVSDLEHFSYTITHDMRAPLRAIQGFAGLLGEQCSDCIRIENKEYLELIKTSASRMDRLITDALQFGRTVQQPLPLKPVNAAPLLRSIIQSYPNLQPPGARIQIEGEIPEVIGNEAGLTQCFSNLLGNAVKFVHPGTVPEVRIWAEQRNPAAGASETPAPPTGGTHPAPVVRIWFEDNGIGISKQAQGHLFQMFQRATTAFEGNGIGLALVKKVVERMEGSVGVESEEGRGSRFWLELRRSTE